MNFTGTQGIPTVKQQVHEAQQNQKYVTDQIKLPVRDIIGDYMKVDELLKFIYKVMVANVKRQQLGWIPGVGKTSDVDYIEQDEIVYAEECFKLIKRIFRHT